MNKILFAIALLVPTLVLASGYEVISVNPRDLALTHSAVAAQIDAAATQLNPSALSRVNGLSLSIGGSILEIDTDWSAPAGSNLTGSAATEFHPATPVAFFAAYGGEWLGRRAGVGLGFATPGGGNQFWPADWQGAARIIKVQRRVYGGYLTGGVEVIPEFLRIGGGVIYYYAQEYLKQSIGPTSGFGEIRTNGDGWSYDASAELKPLRSLPLTIGVDYKHKSLIETTGDGHFEVPPGLESPAVQDQKAHHDFTFPNLLTAGISYRILKPLLFTLQYSWSRWVVYTDDTFRGDKGFLAVVPRNYGNGNIVRGGVEYDLTPAVALRAGVMRDLSGLKTSTYSPTLPDSNTWGFGLGAGLKLARGFGLNGAVFYGDRDGVTSTDNATTTTPGTFPGDYKTRVWIGALSVTWNGAPAVAEAAPQ